MDAIQVVQYIILGAVQGITELLPVSSSAHLLLVPWFLKWQDPGLGFTVALHLGTTAAILLYFRRDWIALLRSLLPGGGGEYRNLLWYLLLATIPGAGIGFVLRDAAESAFRNPLIPAITLVIFALFLWIADRIGKRRKDMGAMSLASALVIGILQALAIIPGVSRSGITITGGLFLGFTREAAARFSFLLSAPIILGAGLVEAPQMVGNGVGVAFWLGMAAAALFGFGALKFLFHHLQHGSYFVFVAYRVILAGIIVIALFMR